MLTSLSTTQERNAWTNSVDWHTVYGAETTPLKQNDRYALCVPSFMFCCFPDHTLFQTEKDRSTSQEVWGMVRIRRAQGYRSGRRADMASHHSRMSNLEVRHATDCL